MNDTDALGRFCAGYYKDPRPALAARALVSVVERDNPVFEVLFGRAAQHDPAIQAAFVELAEREPEHARWIASILDLARQQVFPDPATLQLVIPQHLDYLWSEFLLTGDLAPVRRIAGVLERPDITTTKLNEWFVASVRLPWAKKKKKSQARRLREVGFTMQGPISVDQDLLLWHRMGGGFQAGAELPFAMTDDFVSHLMMKGSACWSMQSNGTQHELVAGLLEELGVPSEPSFLGKASQG